ncbi:MAG: hypothetical protein J6Q20_00485 [Alistipes sp.]|nr:hypothetical protein [Alistipes sp.]
MSFDYVRYQILDPVKRIFVAFRLLTVEDAEKLQGYLDSGPMHSVGVMSWTICENYVTIKCKPFWWVLKEIDLSLRNVGINSAFSVSDTRVTVLFRRTDIAEAMFKRLLNPKFNEGHYKVTRLFNTIVDVECESWSRTIGTLGLECHAIAAQVEIHDRLYPNG